MTPVDAGGPLDVDEAESWVRSYQPRAESLELFQTEPWASVFRAPVDGHVVWFKACAPRQSFEVPGPDDDVTNCSASNILSPVERPASPERFHR